MTDISKLRQQICKLESINADLYEALSVLYAMVGLTPILGNKAALQEAADQASTALAKARGEGAES